MNATASTASAASANVIGGLVVRTAIKAGYHAEQHAEGIVVSTTLKAGQIEPNHVEGPVG